MCGIAGIVGDENASLLEELTAALAHRGPDDEGFHRSAKFQLGVRRLSIVDLTTGAQPIYNEDGKKGVVFNGEIYNFRELREHLSLRGHVFRTRSDTEVIVHLYEEYGERCVEHLRGMFAFAIADGNKLFLARDRLGIKPLYYALSPNRKVFLFASEIKALLRCRSLDCELNLQAFADKLVLGHPVGRDTFFNEIKAFPAGHTMTLTLEQDSIEIRERQYYNVAIEPDDGLALESSEAQLTERLRETIAAHLVADVGIGLTLSGGLDSSLLAMMMNDAYGERLTAYTIADHEYHPDLKQAKLIAEHIRCSHEVVTLSFEEYLREIPACIIAEEQPTSLFGIPFFTLCKRIGTKLKVCLNGEGADELFGGYPEYLDSSYKTRRMRRNLSVLQRLNVQPSHAAAEIIQELSGAKNDTDYLKLIFRLNQQDALVRQHLDIVDKYSMAVSVEMRVPFMDHQLVEFANRLPLNFKADRSLGVTKYLLKRVALNSYGRVMIGPVLREKLGFPSAGANFLARFDELCEQLLPADYLERHALGFCFMNKRQLLVFELFEEFFFQQRGTIPDGFDLPDFMKGRAAKNTPR